MTADELLREYDRRFSVDPDPWRFESSPYEREKRQATLAACSAPSRYSRILELGAANGVLAEELARLGDHLVAVEAVPAAATLARARLAITPDAEVVEGLIPDAVPNVPFDLVVASEILYYLDERAYRQTLQALPTWLSSGGRLVAVHWRPVTSERPRGGDDVHADLAKLPALSRVDGSTTDDYLLEVFELTPR